MATWLPAPVKKNIRPQNRFRENRYRHLLDMAFPEIFSKMKKAGAEIIFCPRIGATNMRRIRITTKKTKPGW